MSYYNKKRIFDLTFSILLLCILFLPMIFIYVVVRITSKGPALYWSERVGMGNVIFRMPKFRTMIVDTPSIATHLLINPDFYITPIGKFLRKSSLDELPQLLSILRGNMSFVGPRPALFNQDELIEMRTKNGIHMLPPGLTGWAQVNGRDEISISDKVLFDLQYAKKKSLIFDFFIIWLTIIKVLRGEGVVH